jgi:uncharacterized membrane protein
MRSKIGIGIFLLGIAIIIAGQFAGIRAGARIHEIGLPGVLSGEMPLFRSFYLSYPLGVIIAVFGVLYSRVESSLLVWISVIGIVLLITYEKGHLIAGMHPNPMYFGIGGGLITLILLGFLWCWAENRTKLGENAKTAADLQMLGYVFFAFAAWTTCGIGSVPCYAIYPEKVQSLQTLPLLFPSLAKIMLFFVLGWFFTLLGQVKLIRSRNSDS